MEPQAYLLTVEKAPNLAPMFTARGRGWSVSGEWCAGVGAFARREADHSGRNYRGAVRPVVTWLGREVWPVDGTTLDMYAVRELPLVAHLVRGMRPHEHLHAWEVAACESDHAAVMARMALVGA